MHTHTYRSSLCWRGSTAAGYESYDRTHRIDVPTPRDTLTLSGDAAFLGDAELPNPEQLLLVAASSCQLLSFLAIAARSRIDVRSYDDEAEAIMPEEPKPMRISRITLRPEIVVVAVASNPDRVRRLVDRAHDACFIANTLNAEFSIEPAIEIANEQTGGT